MNIYIETYLFDGNIYKLTSFNDLVRLENYNDIEKLMISGKGYHRFNGSFVLPDKLKILECYITISELPELPDSLEKLTCLNNGLRSLPKLPEGLRVLEYCMNYMDIVPKLPESLIKLDIRHNELYFLTFHEDGYNNKMPDNLEELYFDNNKISCIGCTDLPKKLKYLILKCEKAKLIYLSYYPLFLKLERCYGLKFRAHLSGNIF